MSANTTNSQPLLEIRNLSKTFTSKRGARRHYLRVLNQVSLRLDAGEAVALVGESGSGKSTIARIAARLISTDEGQMFFGGKELPIQSMRGIDPEFRADVQMIFQDPFASLNPAHLIGYQVGRPLLRHRKVENRKTLRARVEALLEQVGLCPGSDFASRYPHQCSGGQRQRVAIARALAVEPRLILADEPTSMLDVSLRIGVLNLLLQLKREHRIAFLFITHDLASARYFADRIAIMYGGSIVEVGPSEAIMRSPVHPYTRLLLSCIPGEQSHIEFEATQVKPSDVSSSGCGFAPRCPAAQPHCLQKMPSVHQIDTDHRVRCHLYA